MCQGQNALVVERKGRGVHWVGHLLILSVS